VHAGFSDNDLKHIRVWFDNMSGTLAPEWALPDTYQEGRPLLQLPAGAPAIPGLEVYVIAREVKLKGAASRFIKTGPGRFVFRPDTKRS
jgi:hypothetical protein